MGKIAVLPTLLANQIAAGEVIERPASVVKELVENGLDARAGRISVTLAAGGADAIVVRDDGEGMSREDAQLAFARHATSKISSVDDLGRVRSFGFRGEALASIAAAADVELVTRRPADQEGTRVRTRDGGVAEVMAAGAAPGTQVTVRNLFGNLPARRKFLKRPATELGHVAEALTRIGLGKPGVGITAVHEGRQVLDLPPVATPLERLTQIIGREAAEGAIVLEAESGPFAVRAYLARPEHSLSSARMLLTYVCGRFVRDRVVTRAVVDGYGGVLMRGRYPIAAVFLEVSGDEVDVNVHPTKAEVRFRDSGRVHRLLMGGIRDRLRSALAQAPARDPGTSALGRRVETRPMAVSAKSEDGERPDERRTVRNVASLDAAEPRTVREAAPDYRGRAREGAAREAPFRTVDRQLGASPPAQGSLAAEGLSSDEGYSGYFGSLRFLGQVLSGYLVCEGRNGMVLIDQHAAHERVRFERLRSQRKGEGVPQQRLLVPETLSLEPRALQALEEAEEELAALGFEGESFGSGSYILRAVPAILGDVDCGRVLRDLGAERAEVGASRAADRALGDVLARVACHSAVRVGRRMDAAEVAALLKEMDTVDFAGFCPHGRPAFVEFDAAAIERLFKRP